MFLSMTRGGGLVPDEDEEQQVTEAGLAIPVPTSGSFFLDLQRVAQGGKDGAGDADVDYD
jgi:hypothetical protein